MKVIKEYIENSNLKCRFCGKECKNKNSLIQHEIRCKENPNKIDTSKSFNNGNRPTWNKGLTKNIDDRVANSAKNLKKYYETNKGVFTGKKHSDETKKKISNSIKNYLNNHPDKVPYLINHSSKESYPEKYFKEVFEKENIDLEYHKQVGLYQLDFCNSELKIDIEIDGDSHYLDKKTIEVDKRRNEYLNSLGWTTYRIKWSDFKKFSIEEKEKIIDDIKKLLKLQ